MRFPCFEQSNYGSRKRRVVSLFLALCLLFSFLSMPLADAADEAEAPVSAPVTAPAEAAPATPTAADETAPPTESTAPEIPAATETAATETAATETAATEPPATETAATEPPATETAATEPAATEPAATETAATDAPDEPVTEPTETAAPEPTTGPTGTTAPAETTATASSQETTEPTETTTVAETTAPTDTTAPTETTVTTATAETTVTTATAETAVTTATAAPDDPSADDPVIGLFASDTVAQYPATVTCYAAVDGAWKQVAVVQTSRQYRWTTSSNRYFLYHTELAEIYGAFGFDAESYVGTRIFPHTDNNDASIIWADVDAILNAETGEYRIPLSTRPTIFLYYMPANLPGNDAYFTDRVKTADQNCIDANNFYALEPYDPAGIFAGTTLPGTRYIFHGETGSVTLPYAEGVEWIPENPTTGEALNFAGVIDEAAGTITFTLENAAYSVRLRTKSDTVRVIYHAGLTDSLTKLGQFEVGRQEITEDGSVRGLVDYAEKLIKNADDTYTVRGIDNDRAKVTVRSDSSGRSLYYTFAGWRVGSATSDLIFQPGDVLTQADIDQCLAASSGGNAEFYAVWKAYDQNNRLTSLNFFVNIHCEIADNLTNGFQSNPLYDYTASVYSTRLFGTDAITETGDVMLLAPPTSSDSAYEVDAAFRAATTVPIEGTLIEAIPSEEAVLAAIRASDKVIKLDDAVIPHEQITSEHFKLRWYVLKYEHSDGWHVDGVLVAKAARMTVSKTFAGDDEAIAEAKRKFFATVEHEEDGTTVRDFTLRLADADSVTAEGEAGYESYDAATDTYVWSVPARKGRTYTVAEHGYMLADDVKWHHSNRVQVKNCPEATGWMDGTSATVTADSYPNDVPNLAIQTVAFRNLYVQAGLLTVFKSDLGTGHGLRNVTFRLSRTDGTPMQLWQMPGTNRYSSDTTAGEEGYTFLVPYNAATTDENGYFYVKLAVGEYYLDETLPLGYEGASRMRVFVTDDGKVEIAVTVTAGNNPPEGGWLEGVGTPILTVKNRSKLLTEVKAEKRWDNTAEEDRLPVTVELWRGGAKMVGDIYTQTLSEENDWNYTWYDLPLFVDGDYGRYTLREVRIGDTAHDPSAGTGGYENYLVSYDAALYREGTSSNYESTAVWQDAGGRWHYADHLLLVVHNSESRGIISFTKVDEVGRALPGAGFTLYADAACTKVLEHVLADESGFVAFEPVSAGTYYFRETETPHGYRTNRTLYRVVLRGGVATITDTDDATATPLSQIVNVSIARLVLQKEDFTGAPLRDAVFRLSGDTAAAATYTVDDNGKLTLPELPNGNYLLEEVIAPAGYRKLAEPIPFRVDSGEIELESAADSRFYALSHVSGYTYRLTVRNEALFVIPSVGGTGIYPLTLVGTVMMCAAAAVLLLVRRFGKSDADDADSADDAGNADADTQDQN